MTEQSSIQWQQVSLFMIAFIIVGAFWFFKLSGKINLTLESETDFNFLKSAAKAAKLALTALFVWGGAYVYQKLKQ